MGMNYKDGHAKDPDMQRKLGSLNTPKIFLFKDNKAPNLNVTVKHLARIHGQGHGPCRPCPNGHRVYQVRMQDEQIHGAPNIKGNTRMYSL